MITESPYDKKLSDIRQKMAQADKSPKSKIPVRSGDYMPTADGKYASINKETWKSASEAAKVIGSDKVFRSHCNFECQWSGSDYVDGWSASLDVFLYAFDKADAKERLDVFCNEHNTSGYSAMDLSHTLNYSTYTFSDPVESSKEEAEAVIAQQGNKKIADSRSTVLETIGDHILYLPTKKIFDEMKKSVDWAMNALKNMKNADEKAKREAWLKTPDGQAWKQLYDQEQVLLKKLDSWNQKKAAKDQSKAALEKQREQNVADIVDCFGGKSTKWPQYNGHFIPVIVSGGKKFQGKGYLTAIEYKEASFSGYGSSEWDEAMLFCPLESKKFASANLKYCKIDDSVDASKLDQMKEAFYEEKVESTKDWCRRKDPSKDEGEISKWAANIIKKYIPEIDIKKYFGINDINAEKAKSTAEWACSLPDVKIVSKAEYIIKRALQKKGIDPMKYKDVISPILINRFGKTETFK